MNKNNRPNEMLQLTIDKFTFQFPADLRYTEAGIWIRIEDQRARLGISDFIQQKSGDITFATVVPVGTPVSPDIEVGTIETVKANVSIFSPLRGTVVEVNSRLEYEAELINQDPYGQGWLAVIESSGWETDSAALLGAEAYQAVVKQQAEAELAL
jgi:glycine cleavage system H protein